VAPTSPNLPHLYVPYTELAATAARAARPLVTLAQRDKESADQCERLRQGEWG
jgi:hypothetical protein